METDLPDRAITLAWQPFNNLLDNIVRNYSLPLIISRLELLSPDSGEAIAYNLLLPNSSGLLMGPLGGVVVDPAFMAVDAIWREALVSSSPFYRLLCAYRMEDACDELRRVMRSIIKRRGLDLKLPSEHPLDQQALIGLGMAEAEITRLRTVKDLFGHFQPLRNAIAHFLINAGVGSSEKVHIPISDGDSIRIYSIASSAVLYHVHIKIEGLRRFFTTNSLQESMRGAILPLPERKLDFPVRDPNLKRQ